MKIQIASDLHLEFLERRFPDYRIVEPTDADVLVIAGDIHQRSRAIDAFRDWKVPVINVHGNHEAYHLDYQEALRSLRKSASSAPNFRYLECDEYIADNVRFLGCCLWTDYELHKGEKAAAMQEAERFLTDHKLITVDNELFTARDAEAEHFRARAWLEQKLAEPFDGKTVVITHHAPHPGSVHPRFEGNILNGAFTSDLTELVQQADLWIHGHVHDSFDYHVGNARVIANPRGYSLNRSSAQSTEQLEWENPHFDPQLVIEIG